MQMINKQQMEMIYNSRYFVEGSSMVTINEKELTNLQDDLRCVKLTGIDGSFLQIYPEWLKDHSKPYQAKVNDLKLMRRDCDSIVFIEHKGKRYALWIELKTGYNNATKEAMFQIVGSYIRSKIYLNAFAGYQSDDYIELAVVIGHKPGEKNLTSSGNSSVMGNKRAFCKGMETKSDVLARNYRRKLISNGEITLLKAKDFELDKLPFVQSVTFDVLPFVHEVVDGQECEIDIESVLQKIDGLQKKNFC